VIFGEILEGGADARPVLFRGPHVRHVVMPLRIRKEEGKEAGQDVSETKETQGATVTISGPGMKRTVITHDQLKAAAKRVGKAVKKKLAAEAGEEGEAHE
jgi:hypothetical protein